MVDNIKFVIWGAGARGRRLLRFLGSDRVAAYIDGKPSLQGTLIDNTPVMSVEKYLQSNLYGTTWVINTPLFLRDEVQKQIDSAGINKYLSLKDCPDEFYDYEYEDIIRYALDAVAGGDECYLYGFNLYSLLISEALATKGRKIIIVVSNEEYVTYKDNASSIGYISVIPLGMVEKKDTVYWAKQYINEEMEMVKNVGCSLGNCVNFDGLKSPYYNERLEQFGDKYKGQRCFVVATGPSLRISDLDLLHKKKEFCISLNEIYHSFSETQWRPDVFVMTDPTLMELENIIRGLDVKYKIISDNNMDFWNREHEDNIFRIHVSYSERGRKFSSDIAKGVYSSGNVTYCCLQIAVYMGFTSIYLLGVDCNNLTSEHYTTKYHSNMSSTTLVENFNNYSEEVAQKMQWEGYLKAQEFAQDRGINILNATRGGKLTMFERCSIDALY